MKNTIKITVIFTILFIVYHSAEYMIVFKNNAITFFIFQGLFFLLAWLFGNWYMNKGLSTWGLPFVRKSIALFAWGLPLGIFMYALPLVVNIILGGEQIVKIPDIATILSSALPFTIGVFFSSLSEDVLTRGIIYKYFHSKISPYLIIIISAFVYLINHIYRLLDGLESWTYIFMLGIILIIPLILTKNLWFTVAMHWAGNVFFYVTHNVIQTDTIEGHLSSNYLFAICLLMITPLVWLYARKINILINQ